MDFVSLSLSLLVDLDETIQLNYFNEDSNFQARRKYTNNSFNSMTIFHMDFTANEFKRD